MRAFWGVCLAVALAACNRDDGGGARASLLSESGGEVSLADGSSFDFRITSENYKKWDAAQRGISKKVAARFGKILQPGAPTERTINSAVSFLSGEASARQAIESAGLSVREFVVMTVALEQEMRLASAKPVERTEQSMPYDFPPVDTTFIAPHPAPGATPIPVPVDTALPLDTAFGQPRARIDTAIRTPSATVFRRDTILRRDTVMRRDSLAPARVTRDTVRDTTTVPAPVPPDTLPRT